MKRPPTLPVFCPRCRRKVELAIAKLQTGTCVCYCGKAIKMTAEGFGYRERNENVSYHDVVVYVGNVAYRPAQNYALQLLCTKGAGWQLWKVCQGKEELIGEEFSSVPFCIEVGGTVILGTKPAVIEGASGFGWDGQVERTEAATTLGEQAG